MNVMTIDVEDWYHSLEENPLQWSGYEDRIVPSVRRILGILDETGTRATFFVLGHVAEHHPNLIEEIALRGHEIASHGYDHHFIYKQTPVDFERDVSKSLRLLQAIVGRPVKAYRAPYFSITRKSLWALRILKQLGIEYDSSIFPVLNHRYGMVGAQSVPHKLPEGLIEVPPSTYSLAGFNIPIAGGVYFRFSAYAVMRFFLGRLVARSVPVVFYLHPWEIDHAQPRVSLPPTKRVRHYWGLAYTEQKFRRLLTDFRFGPMTEVL